MYVLEHGAEKNRLGISVSKKVGNSVIRHHITRLVREAYRLQEEKFHRGFDVVLIARAASKNVSYQETEKSLLQLGIRHGIVAEE